MAAIDTRFGAGGKNLQPGGSNGKPTLALALRDIADDLAGIRPAALATGTVGAVLVAPVAVTVGTDIAAFTDPPSAAEMALLRTFVNALKADHATLRGEVATMTARTNQIRVDLLDVRSGAGTSGYTLKTTKA
jgi:hypothetical protein